MSASPTGRFVWHELHTTDRARAIAFYAKLTPWEIKDVSMGPGEPYGLCLLGAKDIAGITSHLPPGVPSHWLPYIGVDDVDASAKKAETLGGKIVVPAMDIPEVGRFAGVADPQGATFAVFKGTKTPEPETDLPPLGAFCWEDLWTNDAAAAAKFYSALFGYTVDEVDMGPMGIYRMLKRGDKQTGGIAAMPPNGPPPSWLTYIHVRDVDASTGAASANGANVQMPPTDIPNIGRFSVLMDPTNAAIAFFTPKPPA